MTILKENGFVVEEIDGDYGVSFTKDKEEFYEKFVMENLEPKYWNEYLGDEFVFMFKFKDESVKKICL